ncbi:hypothetical protein [Andreprevotia chitinilytica]|uniref:hypothetical protein n=1 Tax=Andreprevotia chitinilytica TaxID=396808 RepID=UPI0012EB81CD|nr:hypothetical protein [Andreprevotia chitinilytica]
MFIANRLLAGQLLLAILATHSAQSAKAEEEHPRFSLLDAGGRIRTEYSRQTDNSDDKFLVKFEPELKVGIGESSTVFFKPALNLSLLGGYKAAYDDQFERSSWSKKYRFNDYSSAELRELYLTSKVGDGLLTLGKQQIVWGTADGLRVLDVVDPVDFTNFIMDDPADARIPLWSANYQVTLPAFDLQLVWIPDTTFNDYSAEPNWYYLTSPKIIPGAAPAGVTVQQNKVDRPGRNPIKDADYGIRLTKVIGGVDLTFNYLYHYNDDVVIYSQLDPNNGNPVVTVSPTYRRSHLIGGTFSFASGSFVYRGEYGFNSNTYVLTKSPTDNNGAVSRHEFSYVFGVDYSGLTDTMLSVQFFQSILSGSDQGLVRDKVDSTVTLNASRTFLNQTWRTEMLYVYSINDRDSALRARVRYNQSDKTSYYFEFDHYAGTINGLYGEFRDKSRVLLGVDRFF